MGSVNPIVILPGALAERASQIAEGLVNSLTLGSGQFCTNPGLVFLLDEAGSESFMTQVTRLMQTQQPGVLLNERIERGLADTAAATIRHPKVDKLAGGEKAVALIAMPIPYCGRRPGPLPQILSYR
jgi:NADP-dependent aldehyde dehydrogenase